ncbi:MAG: hypothetical protein ACO3NK_14440, partial [Prochlorotrichaceae cyanobacterium]
TIQALKSLGDRIHLSIRNSTIGIFTVTSSTLGLTNPALAILFADYKFNNGLSSDIGGSPDLTYGASATYTIVANPTNYLTILGLFCWLGRKLPNLKRLASKEV